VQEVHVPTLKPPKLTGPEATERSYQDHASQTGFNGVCQSQRSGRVGWHPLGPVLGSRSSNYARVQRDQIILCRSVQDRPLEPVCLGRLVGLDGGEQTTLDIRAPHGRH
jgi:hypothetical protein